MNGSFTIVTFLMILGAALFCIGVMGALTLKNAIRIVMCIELMLNGANITLLATASTLPDSGPGQTMVVFAIAIAAAETIVGLGAIVAMFRAKGWAILENFNMLKG
ncbi:MAG: NADH-quinone oxidoreductase subunit NuoK [Caldisericia bacterium]|nr:NADH-quinone oxidoreductase subunit NuoK [Caldisericia bacterium]